MPRHPDTEKQLDDRPLARLLRSHWLARTPRLTTRNIGEQLGVSHTTVTRWLDGTLLPTVGQTTALADALGITGRARADLLHVAEWMNPRRGTPGLFGISHQTVEALELEKRATSIVEWSPLRIPDFLQIDDYARRITGDSSDTTDRAERQITLQSRQKKCEVFLGLQALTWQVGGVNVMAKQVEQLIDTLDQRSAELRLVSESSDWHDGQLGPFALYERDDGEGAVVIQHLGAVTLLTDRELVERYRQLRATLEQFALTPEETRRRLDDVLRELRTASS
ncbi:helix-turn-helix transcriptional regulator [Amycolatopsis sp. NPDC006131]|uniref:helix-turn-helix domain-containing protein n=1 Tax=Amycolatopsis sp. NPDC006131 TaxID=3156731 RepID=UPI0033BF27F4